MIQALEEHTAVSRPQAVPRLEIVMAMVLLLGTALSWPGDAQSPTSVFGERVEVRVVNLEVVVTDRDGNRVSGLTADDFRLRVDGDEMPIGFFSEISEGQRKAVSTPGGAAEGGGTAEEAAGDGTIANPTGAAPGETVGTSYLVFIDNYFVPLARDRNQVLDALSQQLAELGPKDRMALVAFNGRKLQMLSTWTRSKPDLQAVLAQAGGANASGLQVQSALANQQTLNALDAGAVSVQDDPGTDPGNLSASTREARAAAVVEELETRLERVVLGVTATMRSFARPPGRKVMLLLSGGWPENLCDYITGQIDPISNSGECINRGPRLYRPMYEVANLLGYTLYPVDVPSSASSDVNAAEGDDIALSRNGPGIVAGLQPVPSSFRNSEVHTTLRRLAAETGGVAMIDESRLSSLETVIEDTRSYYWMGFSPEWRGDDRNRKIKLEVLKPGLKLRYREGFKDLSRDQEVNFMVESALLFGELPGAGSLGLALGPAGKGRRKVTVPVELNIPMDEVAMLPFQGRYVAELELRIGALDEFGDRNEIAAVPVKLEGAGPPPAGAHAIYALEINIRNRPQDLVVSLYDPIGDRMLVATERFNP